MLHQLSPYVPPITDSVHISMKEFANQSSTNIPLYWSAV